MKFTILDNSNRNKVFCFGQLFEIRIVKSFQEFKIQNRKQLSSYNDRLRFNLVHLLPGIHLEFTWNLPGTDFLFTCIYLQKS